MDLSVRHPRTMSDMSTAVAQAELSQAPARTTLRVPAGCTSWWGVDGSTRCVSIGVASPSGQRAVRTAPFPKISGPARLGAIYALTRDLALDLARRYPPGLILVEQPSGSSQAVNHELEYAVGVIQAAVYDGAYQAVRHGVPMDTVVASWWKARACGSGAIRKTYKDAQTGRKRPLALEDYEVMRWARSVGYKGTSWDEADALAIAEASRRETALVEP